MRKTWKCLRKGYYKRGPLTIIHHGRANWRVYHIDFPGVIPILPHSSTLKKLKEACEVIIHLTDIVRDTKLEEQYPMVSRAYKGNGGKTRWSVMKRDENGKSIPKDKS